MSEMFCRNIPESEGATVDGKTADQGRFEREHLENLEERAELEAHIAFPGSSEDDVIAKRIIGERSEKERKLKAVLEDTYTGKREE